jgi:hypothetical protein
MITPATTTRDSDTPYLPWPPWAAQHNQKQSYLCRIVQGGQGKYSQVLLFPMVLLTNIANVNDPLLFIYCHHNNQQNVMLTR